jgi:molybdate transport system substrate-binding protein
VPADVIILAREGLKDLIETTVLFPRLGIANEMKDKISTNGAAAVGRGEAEIGLQQVSEVLAVPNVDYAGTIPDEVQYATIYAAAVVANSTQIDPSKRLIAFLSSDHATAAIRKSGMEPLARK